MLVLGLALIGVSLALVVAEAHLSSGGVIGAVASAAAVGSLMIRRTRRPAAVPASNHSKYRGKYTIAPGSQWPHSTMTVRVFTSIRVVG